jgi:hypothetical protein
MSMTQVRALLKIIGPFFSNAGWNRNSEPNFYASWWYLNEDEIGVYLYTQSPNV